MSIVSDYSRWTSGVVVTICLNLVKKALQERPQCLLTIVHRKFHG